MNHPTQPIEKDELHHETLEQESEKMKNLKQIEKEIAFWRGKNGPYCGGLFASGMVGGLELAHTIISLDEKPECNKCLTWNALKVGRYCPECGRELPGSTDAMSDGEILYKGNSKGYLKDLHGGYNGCNIF